MGALHEGHMALVRAADAECDRIVASIFVNPKQFTPTEDLGSYPRREAGDLGMAKDCAVTYWQSGRNLALLTIGRDRDSLAAEIELEKALAAAG